MEERPKIFRDNDLKCVLLYNVVRTNQGRVVRAPTTANDVAALQNEQVVYVSDDNYRNPLREAKHHQNLLKDYFNHLGALAGLDDMGWI